ncbi:MAG: hypothetical protein ACRC1R_00260 [Cetobacterium sp.]|uniref:hypothetical protein n=1 Tax=Cetobacterium sp. TaxID=2071632 RepID=UPI003F37D4E9
MILKFISRIDTRNEYFLDYQGQIGVSPDLNVQINEYYGVNCDKVISLRNYGGIQGNSYNIGIDSNLFFVFLLNNQGQNIQRLV